MRYTKDKLYELLPAIYRQRDKLLSSDPKNIPPLESLLSVIANQIGIVEKDIENLYDNWFIETCDNWVVSYIADLIGIKPSTVASSRAYVANTVGYRRRKGTAPVVEQLAHDITGWKSKAVEFFQFLATTQHVNHIRLSNGDPDLRDYVNLELLNTPFDNISHTVDVRHIDSKHGYYNIQNIGVFLWRLEAYPVINVPAFKKNWHSFTFNQFGFDMQLYNHPATKEDPRESTEKIHVPEPISRETLYNNPGQYYGKNNKSISITVDDISKTSQDIIICDLSKWNANPPKGKVAIDPILGRICFPFNESPGKVYVSYYYGFSSEVGGGSYHRQISDTNPTYEISKNTDSISNSLTSALNLHKTTIVLQINDSEIYEDSIDICIPAETVIEIRSKDEQRPVLKLKEFKVIFSKGSKLMLDGLLIDVDQKQGNKPVMDITNSEGDLIIKNCTLVPRTKNSDSENKVGIIVEGKENGLNITLDRVICGRIQVKQSDVWLTATDSIIDGKGDMPAIECHSIYVNNCTIFGKVKVDIINMASNSIFTDTVYVKRTQEGCIRFSYFPPQSNVPHKYECQSQSVDSLSKIIPQFTSEKYGESGYAQLSKDTPKEIFEGADNKQEMGVFNHLYQAQCVKNLVMSLDEYMRFGLEAGVFYVT